MDDILRRLDAIRGAARQHGLYPWLVDELLDTLQTLVLTLLNEQALACGEPCDPDYGGVGE